MKLNAGLFRVLCNLWPPLFFTGIKATYVSPNFRDIKVTLKLRWYTRNYVGVQYGGSLMSMTDPWYMLMLLNNLGNDYFIWDKHAEIDYIAPGKTHVHAEFKLTQDLLDDIREKTANGDKYLPVFIQEIWDNQGTLIARVKRTVYIKLKPRARNAG